jgi:Glycosyltransferase 61
MRKERVAVKRTRHIHSPEYARRFGATWQVVHPAETPVRVPPVRYGHIDAGFEAVLDPIPDLGVLTISNGTVVGPSGLVLTKEGLLLEDASFWRDRTKGVPDSARRAEVEKVRGTLVTLGSDYAFGNYGHYLMDSLPRLSLLEDAGVRIADADHIYVTVPGPHAARLLDELGVPTAQRIVARPGAAIRADTVIVASYPGSRRNYPRWHVQFLRDRLGVPAGPPSRRLYIPRAEHRQILNIAELMPILQEHGFEVFEPRGAEDPRHAFAEAQVVVGGHGAGLADLAFCSPGTRVLELFPESHRKPFYMTLSGSADLRYGYLIGEAVPGPEGVRGYLWDYTIDPGEFRMALEATLA